MKFEFEELNNSELSQKQIEDIRKWLTENWAKVQRAFEVIQKSGIKELSAEFTMWDTSCRYWSSDMACEVTSTAVHIIERAYDDEGRKSVWTMGSVKVVEKVVA